MALFLDAAPELTLVGPRVLLRPPRRGDYRAWSELRAVSRGFLEPWEPAWPEDGLTRAAYRRRLRRVAQDWRDDQGYAFHVVERHAGSLLGGVALANVRRGVALCASVGYWIGQPFARKGYMAEALACIVGHVFDDLGLHRLEAACLPRNAPSRALLLKLGFVEEGLARRYLKINGAWEDHVLFGLLREDAEAARLLPPPPSRRVLV